MYLKQKKNVSKRMYIREKEIEWERDSERVKHHAMWLLNCIQQKRKAGKLVNTASTQLKWTRWYLSPCIPSVWTHMVWLFYNFVSKLHKLKTLYLFYSFSIIFCIYPSWLTVVNNSCFMYWKVTSTN